MSTHYSFYLRVGFKVDLTEIKKHFEHNNVTHEEGIFHMEDRFNPRTGVKMESVKVWDKKPKTTKDVWWEINGERFEGWDDEVMTRIFEKKLGCHVDYYWQSWNYPNGNAYGFYLHDPNNKDQVDGGRFIINNLSMDYAEVVAMQPKLAELKQKLLAMGIDPGEPQVFLGEVSG